MSFLRYTVLIWTCLLVIAGIEALYCGERGSLIYSVESAIRERCLWQQTNEQTVTGPPERPVRVTVSAKPDIIYWLNIDGKENSIMRTWHYSFSYRTEVIADKGLVTPEELAVDWITENIYFMDSSKKHIGVCTEDGSYCTTILNSTTDTPGGLVLNPKRGEMFWSDYGKNPSIWRAGMDGSGPKPILTEDLGWPKGLAIDYSKDRLYWIDSKLKTVESMSLDGKDRQRFLQTEGKRLHSLAISDDKLYWSDWEKNVIESMDLGTGDNRKIIVKASKLIHDIKIRHSSLKSPLPNPCENADCSEICLLAPDSRYSCACELGNVLDSDLRTCSPINKTPHLVIAAGEKMIHYREGIIGKSRFKEILMPIRMSRIAYDRKNGILVADDQFTHFLYSFDPESSEIRRLERINSEYLRDIDIEPKYGMISWSASGLYEMYRFLASEDEIRISERNSFEDKPIEILSIPGLGEIFVVFETRYSGFHIDLVNFDRPKDAKIYIPKVLGYKVSLAYDERSMRLYFSEERDGTIESFSVQNIICGKDIDRKMLRAGVGKPVSLAVLNGKLYWTNRNSNVLNWMVLDDDILEIKSTILPVSEYSELLDIVTVGNNTLPDNIPCD